MEPTARPKEILVTVEGGVKSSEVMRAIKMLRGVTAVSQVKKRKPCLYNPETGEYVNDETMQVIMDARSGKDKGTSFKTVEAFKAWCEAL